MNHFALHSCLALFSATILSSSPLRLAASQSESLEREEIDRLTNYEASFLKKTQGDVGEGEFLEILRLNFFINSRTTWQSHEILMRAEALRTEIGTFMSANSGYSEFLKEEILELHHNSELRRSSTHKLNLSELFWFIEFLPTPEVVIMLGSLLEYDEGYFVDGHLTKAIERKSIAARAMETINRYPLIEPELKIDPSNIKLAYPDVLVPQWQAWWQEIVDGERVFQLEGDPTRYNHLGPVSADWKPKSASLATATPSAQTPSRTSPPRTTPSPEIKAQENRFLWASLALVVIALLAWAKTRFQKKPTKSF